MKPKVNSIRMLAMCGLSVMMLSTANAAEPEKVILTLLPNKQVIIEANIPRDQSAILEITNLGTLEVLYNDKMRIREKAVYDLEALPEGKYSLVIKHGKLTHKKDILLTDEKSYLIREAVYTDPVFTSSEDGKLSVRYLNHTGESVRISFFKESDIYFSDEIGTPTSFERSYNLKNLESGIYNVVLKSGDRTFYYDLKM